MRLLQLLLPLLFRSRQKSRGGGILTMGTVIVLLGVGAYLSRQYPWIGRMLESAMRVTTGVGSSAAPSQPPGSSQQFPAPAPASPNARDRSSGRATPPAGPKVDGSLVIRDVPADSGTAGSNDPSGEAELRRLFREKANEVWVQAEGVVDRILPDDTMEPRHQQWIMRFPAGHTIKIAHNIDIAQRVPIREGAAVRLRGQYMWSEQGGVVHFTHKPKYGNRAGGWVEADRKRYE